MKTSSFSTAKELICEQASVSSSSKTSRYGLFKRYGEGFAALTSGILIALAWGVDHVSHAWSVAIYLLAFVVGGFVKGKEGLHTLIAERDLDVNLLMIAAAIGAASIGYWTEGAILIFIFSLSGALRETKYDLFHWGDCLLHYSELYLRDLLAPWGYWT